MPIFYNPLFIYSCVVVRTRSLSASQHTLDSWWANQGSSPFALCWSRSCEPEHTDTDDELLSTLSCDVDSELSLTWRQGWCRCCLAVGGQVFSSCGRRTEEGNPSDTETASLSYLSLLCDRCCLLARLPLVAGPCCCFLFLFVSRMWDENGGIPAVCSRRYGLLKGKHNLGKGFISYTVMKYAKKYPVFLSMEETSGKNIKTLLLTRPKRFSGRLLYLFKSSTLLINSL